MPRRVSKTTMAQRSGSTGVNHNNSRRGSPRRDYRYAPRDPKTGRFIPRVLQKRPALSRGSNNHGPNVRARSNRSGLPHTSLPSDGVASATDGRGQSPCSSQYFLLCQAATVLTNERDEQPPVFADLACELWMSAFSERQTNCAGASTVVTQCKYCKGKSASQMVHVVKDRNRRSVRLCNICAAAETIVMCAKHGFTVGSSTYVFNELNTSLRKAVTSVHQ